MDENGPCDTGCNPRARRWMVTVKIDENFDVTDTITGFGQGP
jgi:hypothetical protein